MNSKNINYNLKYKLNKTKKYLFIYICYLIIITYIFLRLNLYKFFNDKKILFMHVIYPH